MISSSEVVFLFDVDNTLLDNDRVQGDLRSHLEDEFGAENRDRYWAIIEKSCAPSLAIRTTWVPYSATVSKIFAIRDCF